MFVDSYSRVPKGFNENLQYRIDIRNLASKDAGYRSALREVCREDFLFFINSFGYLFEPRTRKDEDGNLLPKLIPFITWPHQDPVFRDIRQNLGVEEVDLSVEKSRGEGASWMAVWLAQQDWTFKEMVKIGFVSATLEKVYKAKDPDTLFWKLDFARDCLPKWMVGEKDPVSGWSRNLNENTMTNNLLMNTIAGYAATGQVGSGGRCSWFFMDELSKFPRPDDEKAMDATLSVTDNRLIVGTPLGAAGAYYEINHEDSSVKKYKLHWADNISKNRGLYVMRAGRPMAVDPENNPLPAHYDPPSKFVLKRWEDLRKRGFNLEKGERSDWYDRQCHRPRVTPQTIAQELDIDYGGSRSQRFGSDFFKILAKTIRPPLNRGELHHNEELKPKFDYHDSGGLFLWCNLDHELKPPRGSYSVACDIASGFAGTYTANSTIEVFNNDTGEQVAEFASNNIQQTEFADLAMAMAYWFHKAKLGWEYNFASGFTERVLAHPYPNIYLRPILGKKRKRQSARQDVGWWTDGKKTKPLMFDDIDFFIREEKVIVRSAAIKDECTKYIVDEQRKIEFEGSLGDSAHGDRVIGMGVAIQMIKELITGDVGKEKKSEPQTEFDRRERDFDKEDRKRDDDGWDHTIPSQLVGSYDGYFSEEQEFGWS